MAVTERYLVIWVNARNATLVRQTKKSFKKEYDYLGSHSGRDGDKFDVILRGGDSHEKNFIVCVGIDAYGADINHRGSIQRQGFARSLQYEHAHVEGRKG